MPTLTIDRYRLLVDFDELKPGGIYEYWINSPDTLTSRPDMLLRAMIDHAEESANGPMEHVFAQNPHPVSANSVVVATATLLSDTEEKGRRTTLACVDIDALEPGDYATNLIPAPYGKMSKTFVARMVSYTKPQLVRMLLVQCGINLDRYMTHVQLDTLVERAERVEHHPLTPVDGFDVVPASDPLWDCPLHRPGTDLEFDMAWAHSRGIASRTRLRFAP